MHHHQHQHTHVHQHSSPIIPSMMPPPMVSQVGVSFITLLIFFLDHEG
jgi:hypothetical protein